MPADDRLDPFERELIQLLEGNPTLRSLRYDRHSVAHVLAGSRLEQRHEGLSAAHVLNGAWVMRRRIERQEREPARRDEQLQRLAEKATCVMREVLESA